MASSRESRTPGEKERLINRWPLYYWRRFPLILAANGFDVRRVTQIPRGAVRQALEMGYFRWTHALGRWCKGRDVVDVGCGMGLHGVGFLLEGARSYTGIDPTIKPRSDVIKDLHSGERVACGWTPESLMARMPRFKMIRGITNEIEGTMSFDLATLHNATEHLTDLPGVFASVHRLLRPGGLLIFSHHNWFSWNGHHRKPKTVPRIRADDAEQRLYYDWEHLRTAHAPDSYVMTKLNRLRLSEVRAITEEHFIIEVWQPVLSTPNQGAGRLTAEIRARNPDLDEADFVTQSVFVVARRR